MAPEDECHISRHGPHLPKQDRRRLPCADPAPQSPPGLEPPLGGAQTGKTGKTSKTVLIIPIFRRSNRRAATPPSQSSQPTGSVGRNGTGIGVPDHELPPKPAKPAKTISFYFIAPEAECHIPRPGPHSAETVRTRPPCADLTPRSPPGNEPPHGGPKPAKQAIWPRSCPFFSVHNTAWLPPHPDAPDPLVPWDETEPQLEAPIMSYGRNRQNRQKQSLLL